MAASTSSSQDSCRRYEVFISFRGPDVRRSFLSHLEKALHREKIEVFVDDRLERGDEISSSLMRAIEESIIALVIFSEDYASSRWCLEELVKIMERKEVNQQIVIPVFFLVDPSDVRHQNGTYAEAFTNHEDKLNDKVETWRSVLKRCADLSGHNSSTFKNEAELVEEIVKDVLKKLKEHKPNEPKSQLIGFQENFEKVESLMKMKSQEEVRMVGIWGMGGIGKTTLARAIFNKFMSQFESHSFLENVRARSEDGLSSLQKKLLSDLLGIDINLNYAMGRLQWKKVLIVLDDVNDSKQLKDLVHSLKFGFDSTIVVTSRDRQVFRSGWIPDNFVYEVKELNPEESLELFSEHAFRQSHPKMGYEELSKMTVATAQGLPLALEILGGHFCGRAKDDWESELNKLKKSPNEDIQKVLRISYEGLSAVDKQIFLDIAFFHRGERKEETIRGLKACSFEAVSGIQNLMNKALIKLSLVHPFHCDESIIMHDLVQEMADQIVCDKRNPERLSRLKDVDQINDIVESKEGIDEIEGIILKPRKKKYPHLKPDFFIRMRKLRILKISVLVKFPSSLLSFPKKIRCLYWDYYPFESLPSGSWFENLVELVMRYGKFKKLWDGKQDLANLKKIDVSHCVILMELPDLSLTRRLEIVNLSYCINLRSVHPSILSLHTIVRLDVFQCEKLES